MINPKYDSNNYFKHQAIPVITDNHKINQLFESSLLRIKWWYDNLKPLPQSDFIGTLRIKVTTPLGELEPTDYQLKISSHKQVYVQFLQIPNPDFQYSIEVIHPVGITRSRLEIWEYVKPITTLTKMSESYIPQNSALPQATIDQLTVAMNENTTSITQAIAAADAELPIANFQFDRSTGFKFDNARNTIESDQLRESISFNNTGTSSLKVCLSPIAEGTLYSDVMSFEEPLIPVGGRLSFDGDAAKGAFYLITEADSMVTITGSAQVPVQGQ